MKVTVTFESTMNEDGEDSLMTFTKEGIEFYEDYLHAVGRAGRGVGFECCDTLTGTLEGSDTKFIGKF